MRKEEEFFYWVNSTNQTDVSLIKTHYMKQVKFANMFGKTIVNETPILQPKLGRIVQRNGSVQITSPRTTDVKFRSLFLFTDMIVLGKVNRYPLVANSSSKMTDVEIVNLKQIGPYHCFDYNNERILLCMYNKSNRQVVVVQADKENYNNWANDIMVVVRRTQEYYDLKNSFANSHASCYLCDQTASLMKRLYICWSCGCAACADCTVVVPWHFQYGCVCALCEIDIRYHLMRL